MARHPAVTSYTGRVLLFLGVFLATAIVTSGLLRAGEAQPATRPTRSDELRLDTLKVGSLTYTNVRILPQTGRNIVITHAGGMTTVNADDLRPEDAARLGSHVPQANAASARSTGSQPVPERTLRTARRDERSLAERFTDGAIALAAKEIVEFLHVRTAGFILYYVILGSAILLPVHLLYALFLRRVCQKAASPAGALVWFPVLQLIPAHRAAGISPWWAVLWPLYGLPAPFIIGALSEISRWGILLEPLGGLPALYLVGKLCVARGRSFSMVFALVVLPFFATIALLAFRADGSLVLASLVLLAGPYRVFAYPYLALAD